VSAGRHRRRRLRGRGPIVLLVILALLGAGGAGSAYAAYQYDQARDSRILPGITVGGVAVGNMARDQAIQAVERTADRTLERRLTIKAGRRSWQLPLSSLGLSVDVSAAVDRALSLSQGYSWVSRVYHRLAHKPVNQSVPLGYSFKGAAIKTFLATVSQDMAKPARNAAYTLVDGAVKMVHSHDGQELAPWRSWNLLRQAVMGQHIDAPVTLPLLPVAPKVTDHTVGKAIVVNRTTNMLQLFDGFKVIRTYPVATARPGFETPPGAWEVVNKVENPTWYNPCLGQPGCWAASEPATIPPGPDNPLGTRALYLNAPGIRIHGTPEDSSIGTYASHGCIRMHISDSEALYPLVPIGIPAFIVGAPPWGDVASPGTPGT
jgi:lipoprotein-anchoring transpeptidase ErfK/SrfK